MLPWAGILKVGAAVLSRTNLLVLIAVTLIGEIEKKIKAQLTPEQGKILEDGGS